MEKEIFIVKTITKFTNGTEKESVLFAEEDEKSAQAAVKRFKSENDNPNRDYDYEEITLYPTYE